MNKRWIVLGILALALLWGIGSFAYNAIQTRSQLGLVAGSDSAKQEEGVKALMARNTLFDALQGGAPLSTRLNAISALERVAKGTSNPASFKELLQMLKDPDTESAEAKTHPVRDAAKDAVAHVGTNYPDALLDAAKDADGNIRDQSRAALKQIGKPMAEKMASRLGDSGLRAPLGDILSGIGPETVSLVAPYLKPPKLDPNMKPDDLKTAKLELIEIMGKYKVAQAAEAIIPFATDPEPNVSRGVVTALANIGNPVGASVLVNALNSQSTDPSARAASAGALGGIATSEATASLSRALNDYDLSVATAAAAGLRRAGDKAAQAVAEELSNASPTVRARAAVATGGMSLPTLAIRALTDADGGVRAEAVLSLGDVLVRQQAAKQPIPPFALVPLVKALQDSENRVAANASIALSRLGDAAVPSLLPLLSSSNDTLAYQAAETLQAIGRPAVPSLLTLAQPGKPSARWAAVTLGRIGDPAATSALQTLAQSPDADTAQAATNALAKVKA